MDLRGVVRLYDVGSSGVLVGMEVTKIQGGFNLRRDPSHVDNMAALLGLEQAKPSKTPEAKGDTKQPGDDELLSAKDHHL